MALNFLSQPQESSSEKPNGFDFKAWYQKNKQRLSEKRAKRYREDKEYRDTIIRRSRESRSKQKAPVVEGFTIAFNDAARQLELTPWVLREWKKKGYFPEPHRREGRLWFSEQQVELLQRLVEFFRQHGQRVSDSKRSMLDPVVSFIFHNWN